MLTAPWGTGKSYYIKNNLIKFLEENKLSCLVCKQSGRNTSKIFKLKLFIIDKKTAQISLRKQEICADFAFYRIKNYFKLRIYEIMFSVYGNFVVRNGRVAFSAGAN